ncbi:MAG TPA: cytochrome c oxidase subunit 3 [Gemmatimonadales bacterium]
MTTYPLPETARKPPVVAEAADVRPPGRWAMILVVATEAAFFAYLLFSYYYLASMAREPWPPDGPLRLHLSLPNTIVLLASSATAQWAEWSARRGNRSAVLSGLLVTLLLGIAFLVVQGLEYSEQRFGPTTDAYGSLFFTITGFHGAHVLVGLIMLAVVSTRAAMGHFQPGRHLAVSNAVLYWHFVDAVWLAVFITLYLSPRLI